MTTKASFRSEATPIASVVVVGWRSAPYLVDCLAAVAATVEGVAYEVIVVLNEPTPELEERLADLVKGAVVVRTRVNVGFGGAVNLGAEKARGEYLVLLNDDAEVLPGWLESLVETAEHHPELGAVGSKLLFDDGSVQEIGAVIWSDGSATNVGRGQSVGSSRYGFERTVDYCSGCSLLVPRAVWLEVGGFDEDFFPAYYEDVDLCLRIRAAGRPVLVQPRSQVMHRLSASTGGSYRSFLLEHNRKLLLDHWSDVLPAHGKPAPEDPVAVDRAVWRAMAEPVDVLVILDGNLSEDAAGKVAHRAQLEAAAVLGCDVLRLDTWVHVPTGAPSANLPGRERALPAQPSLGEHLALVRGRYALVVIAVRALEYASIAKTVRSRLAGVPVVLDAEVLRVDAYVVEEARAAELDAALDADYLACDSEEVAETLMRSGEAVEHHGSVVLYGPPANPDEPEDVAVEVDLLESSTSPASVAPTVRTDLAELREDELVVLSRELVLKDNYARHLELQIVELLGEIARRDAHVQRTEEYAGCLTDQIEELADEIERKNDYIRQKEADALYLADELAATQRRTEAGGS